MAKPEEKKINPWKKRWLGIRWILAAALSFTILDACVFGVYGYVNPIGWLYGFVFLAILFLLIVYRSGK